MKIRKNDKVIIDIGKDRGKTGNVEHIFAKEGKVLVAGLNLYKRHTKPRSEGDHKTGGIISVPRPIGISKVSLICPKCSQPTRVGYQLTGKDKFRICRKCDKVI